MLAAVEATLLGKDQRLVAKCDVPGILAVFEAWDIYDVDTQSRFGALYDNYRPGFLHFTVIITGRKIVSVAATNILWQQGGSEVVCSVLLLAVSARTERRPQAVTQQCLSQGRPLFSRL